MTAPSKTRGGRGVVDAATRAIVDEFQREAEILDSAKVLSGETIECRCWNDDAYGFTVLLSKEETCK